MKDVVIYVPLQLILHNVHYQLFHGWPSTQPGSLHTAVQRKYTQPCSLFSRGTAVWTMGARLCEQWGTAVCNARLCIGSPVCSDEIKGTKLNPPQLWKTDIRIIITQNSFCNIKKAMIAMCCFCFVNFVNRRSIEKFVELEKLRTPKFHSRLK